MTTLFGTKQQENKSLQDYTKWFCVARPVLESQFGGPTAPTKYVEQESNYDAMNETIVKECCSPSYIWRMLTKRNMVLSYKVLLSTQQSLHNDQYLKTVIDANNVLSNHKFDNYKSQAHWSGKDREKSDKNSNDDKEDKDEQEVPMSFAQLKGRCYCCGKPGHRSPDCQEKDKIPWEEWLGHQQGWIQPHPSIWECQHK